MKKVKREIVHFVEYRALLWVAKIFYVAGLAALIPIMSLILAPERLWDIKVAVIIAFGLIFLSFTIIYWFTKSKRESFEALGLMTLIPGLLAALFAYAGERPFLEAIAKLGPASPYVQHWLEAYVPRSWLLAGVYILLGTALIYLSQEVKY